MEISAACEVNCLLLIATKNSNHGLVYYSCDPDNLIEQFGRNSFKTVEKYVQEDVSWEYR